MPKKGDLHDPFYYRRINLTAVASKIYKSILNRLVSPLDTQNGFRRGRSTISQILALCCIIEEMRNANRKRTLVFADFKKAFDSVDRQDMFEVLDLYGIPQEIYSQCYQSALYRYQRESANPLTLDIVSGILQGDTLAPFIIVLDYILRNSLDACHEPGMNAGLHL